MSAADGAVTLIERLSPALEQVDSSSGAIGTAVNNALHELVAMIASAPVHLKTRDAWLERLWEAHAADQIPYIERLADDWGALCASKDVASAWADRLLGITRVALSTDKTLRGYFHGTSACLSALFRAERYQHFRRVREWLACPVAARISSDVRQRPFSPNPFWRIVLQLLQHYPSPRVLRQAAPGESAMTQHDDSPTQSQSNPFTSSSR